MALGGIDVPSTYEYACTYQPTYVRMLLTYLHRRYGVASPEGTLDGAVRPLLRRCRRSGQGRNPQVRAGIIRAIPHMALTPGDRLGPYEIQSALGAGGMGETQNAFNPTTP